MEISWKEWADNHQYLGEDFDSIKLDSLAKLAIHQDLDHED